MPLRNIDPSWLLTFFKTTTVVTWAVEKDGMVVDIPEWSRLTGQTSGEAKGEGWMNAIHPDDRNRVSAAWHTAIEHGSTYNTDYRIYCADGIYRWFNVRGAPILDPDGNIIQWIGVVLDVPGHHRFGHATTTSDDVEIVDISPEALRASRSLLNWTVVELSTRSGVSLSTIKRLESPSTSNRARSENILRLISTITGAGVKLLGENGVATGANLLKARRVRAGAVG